MIVSIIILINTKSIKSNSDRIASVSETPSYMRMFATISKIIGRPLAQSESTTILDIIFLIKSKRVICSFIMI